MLGGWAVEDVFSVILLMLLMHASTHILASDVRHGFLLVVKVALAGVGLCLRLLSDDDDLRNLRVISFILTITFVK